MQVMSCHPRHSSRPFTGLACALLLVLATWIHPLIMGIADAEEAQTTPFVFADIDGRSVRLTDFRGKWVLVNFWAHWCPLCWLEVPTLNELNRRTDFVVIGIGLDYGTNLNLVREAASQHNLDFRAIVAGGARRDPASPYRQVGPVDFFPTSYLFDPNGELAMFLPGQVRVDKLQSFMAAWQSRTGGPAPLHLAVNFGKVETLVRQRHGSAGLKAYNDWHAALIDLASRPVALQLAGVNDFFNKHVRLDSDLRVWGRDNYWATPGETLGKGRGDSENLAIAKYFSLSALGIPAERLRLTYTRPASGTAKVAIGMVLAYYPAPNADPLILDARMPAIKPASERSDLKPVYSFNSLGVWGNPAGVAGRGDNLPVWQDLLVRARNEGFE